MPLKPRKYNNYIDADDPRVSKFGHPAPPWLINYADLMTELVCFFIILYALSAALSKHVQEAKKVVEEMMKEENIAGEVKVTKEGLKISLEEYGKNVFFESGSATPSETMLNILDKIAPSLLALTEKRHDIIVEGHTDNVPILSQAFASNWELSTSRATNVVHHLVEQKNFPPQRIAAIGYGEFRPVAPNDTPESKAKNRRVVFFVKNPTKQE